MADAMYTNGKFGLIGLAGTTANDKYDWVADDCRLLLVKSGYVFSAAHKYVSDLTPASNEVSGTGYARKTLSGKACTAAATVLFDASDPAVYSAANGWSSIAAVVYKYNASDASALLISYHDCAVTANGGDITVQFSSSPAAVFTLA